ILPLDSYAKQYHWFKAYPTAVLAQQMVSANFKTLGQGQLYEMSSALGGPQGIYYNANLMKELHLSVPSTLSGFEDAMAVAKKAGIVPMEVGLQDQVQITVPLYQVLDTVGNSQTIANLVYGIGNVSIAATGMGKAAQIVEQWGKAGYFSPDAAGISSGQALNNFLTGQGLFYPGWAGDTGTPSQNARTGFFVLDGSNGKPTTADNASIAFAISSHCPVPSLAAQYLNFVSSPAAAKIAVQNSLLPQIPVAVPNQPKNLIFTSQVRVANAVGRANGYVPYFDEATLTMLTTIERNGESLAAGQESPQAFVAALQSDYTAFHKG
ncbi:MAG: ABC transporter substrate-binding protein, partial [Deltaproteobacteria bacterium]